jgi:hypothetical protein
VTYAGKRGDDWHDEDTLPSIPSPQPVHLRQPSVSIERPFVTWMLGGAWSFVWRATVTVAATYTVYMLMAAYYRIEFGTMLVAAAVVLIVTRIWAKWP